MEEKKSTQVDRRTFVKLEGVTAPGLASIDASSYARRRLHPDKVEVVVVCDI